MDTLFKRFGNRPTILEISKPMKRSRNFRRYSVSRMKNPEHNAGKSKPHFFPHALAASVDAAAKHLRSYSHLTQ